MKGLREVLPAQAMLGEDAVARQSVRVPWRAASFLIRAAIWIGPYRQTRHPDRAGLHWWKSGECPGAILSHFSMARQSLRSSHGHPLPRFPQPTGNASANWQKTISR